MYAIGREAGRLYCGIIERASPMMIMIRASRGELKGKGGKGKKVRVRVS